MVGKPYAPLVVPAAAHTSQIDPWTSRAFAVADHQVAHVYVADPADLERVRELCAGLTGVADVLDAAGKAEAGLDHDLARTVLDELEADTERAIAFGFSVNPVVHAFARTARVTGFGPELTKPFFASMRMDLERTEHDQESFDRYVYGSAEVVGLMCLRAFVHRAA